MDFNNLKRGLAVLGVSAASFLFIALIFWHFSSQEDRVEKMMKEQIYKAPDNVKVAWASSLLEVELDTNGVIVEEFFDDHTGFFAQGETYMRLNLSKEAYKKYEKSFSNSPFFRPAPLPQTLKGLSAFENDTVVISNFPFPAKSIEKGYFLFADRQKARFVNNTNNLDYLVTNYNPKRGMNIVCALLSEEESRFYLYVLDD